MRILVVRHVPFEGLGRIADSCEAAQVAWDYADLTKPGAACPKLEGYHGLILLGGPMSANDREAWVDIEIELIRAAIERDLPILGVCLGSQLIAKALGANVGKNPHKEIGWFDLDFTQAAAGDALFDEAAQRETVFHWHGETFGLPKGAILLASSKRCRNQAFRYGQKIYGLQFHLEVTPGMIAEWMVQDENCGEVCGLEAPIDTAFNQQRLTALSRSVFGKWLGLLRATTDSIGKNHNESRRNT